MRIAGRACKGRTTARVVLREAFLGNVRHSDDLSIRRSGSRFVNDPSIVALRPWIASQTGNWLGVPPHASHWFHRHRSPRPYPPRWSLPPLRPPSHLSSPSPSQTDGDSVPDRADGEDHPLLPRSPSHGHSNRPASLIMPQGDGEASPASTQQHVSHSSRRPSRSSIDQDNLHAARLLDAMLAQIPEARNGSRP